MYYNAAAIAFGGGYSSLAKARSCSGTFEAAWESLPENKRRGVNPEGAYDALLRAGIRIILDTDTDYPVALREIPFPPLGLYIKGVMPGPADRTLAIVGTRRAGSYGRSLAGRFAKSMAESGFSISTGLSYGIDAAAAEGCLAGKGSLIAVLANSLDHIYPRCHASLAHDILESGGCLISETPIGVSTLPFRFLQRNRIVSGLSRGVLIVEAPHASGSMSTARFATEQNKDVFVLPGLATDENYAGSHSLIRDGAQLVTDSAHILSAWEVNTEEKKDSPLRFSTPEEEAVWRAIRAFPEGVEFDKILEVSKLSVQEVSRAITFLLLQNAIRENEKGFCA